MDPLINSNGRGSLGTPTNRPICDEGTMACTQNKPAVPRGAGADEDAGFPSSVRADLSRSPDIERDYLFDWIRDIGPSGKHPASLEALIRLRGESARSLTEAIRETGSSASPKAIWCQKVLAAYEEAIAEDKSRLGNAIEALRQVLANSSATEKDRRKTASTLVEALHRYESQDNPPDNDSKVAEAMSLIVEVVKQDAEERTTDLEKSVEREKRSPGSVPDDEFRNKIRAAMGCEHQKAMLGIGGDAPSKVMTLVVDSLNLAADRRISRLNKVLDKEMRSPGSISGKKLVELVQAVEGDGRQRELLGISGTKGNTTALISKVIKIYVAQRKAAIAALFRKQTIAGSGIGDQQVNQAIDDYEAVKKEALRWGIATANIGDIPDQDFKAEHRNRQ